MTLSISNNALGFAAAVSLALASVLPNQSKAADACEHSSFVSGTQYSYGDLVSNAGGIYHCNIGGWCSSPADWAYEPGVGLYWTEAWSLASNCSLTDQEEEPNQEENSQEENADIPEQEEQTPEGNNDSDNQPPEEVEEPEARTSWMINNSESSLQFITVKKESVAEVQSFTNMTGGVDDLGRVKLVVELASVDTMISLRDERIRNFLFETDLLPELQLEAQIDVAQVNSLQAGQVMPITLETDLQLHGLYKTVNAELLVIKLPNNRVQVTSAKPIIIKGEDFNLDGGIEYLRDLAGLNSIGNSVPVYLNLVMDYTDTGLNSLATQPAPVADLSVQAENNYASITLNWTDSSDDETHYLVQHKLENGFWVNSERLAMDTYRYTYEPKSSGNHAFRVIAVNTSTPSDLSNEVSVNVQLAEVLEPEDPEEPVQANYSYAGDCAACHGANGEGNNGIPALTDPGYTLASLTSIISDTMPFGDSSSCVGDCAADIAQYILDNFVPDEVEVPALAPAAVSSVIAVASSDQDRIGLSWTDNSAVETGSKIFRKVDSASWELLDSVAMDIVSFTDNAVQIGSTYSYRVQAFNHVGDALAITSNTVELVEVVSIPQKPTSLTVQRDLEAVLLNWNIAIGQVDNYLVEKATNGGNWSYVATLGSNQTMYEDLNTLAGDQYSYRVKAANSAGTSTASSVVSITMPVNLTGQTTFESKCAGCHSENGIGGHLLGDFIKLNWADDTYTKLLDKVMTMPAVDCDAACREEAAQYLWSDAWGYALEETLISDTDRGFQTIRLLTPYEYRNAVNDLTGVWIADADMPNAHFDDEFKYPTQANLGIMLNDEVIEYMNLAESIASNANLTLLGCNANTCSSSQISTMAERVLRRQLSASELTTYQGFLSTYGARDTLASMLMSPYFLYRVEIGEWNNEKDAYQLDDYEIATALSFQLYGTTPDASLLSKARSGQLSTEQQVRDQANNMMNTSRFSTHYAEFIRYYTKTYDDVAEKPSLTSSMITAMREEQEAAVNYLMDSGSATIDELFNPGYTFVNNELADHYNVSRPGTNLMTKVTTDAQRGGILHQGILQVANSDFAATSLVKRGKMIRENMMCHTMGVPSGIDPSHIEIPANPITTRERWDVITGPDASDGQCWQCHRLMNEPGSALEAYDQEGRFRTTERAYNDSSVTLAIDPAGTLRDNSGLIDIAYYLDARGLAEQLAGMDDVRECYVESYLRYSMGHEPDSLMAGATASMKHSFVEDGNIRELTENTLAAESFLYRLER